MLFIICINNTRTWGFFIIHWVPLWNTVLTAEIKAVFVKWHKQWRAFSCLLVIVFDAELQYLKCSFTSFVHQIKRTDSSEILQRFWQHKLQLILLFCFNQPLMVSMIIHARLFNRFPVNGQGVKRLFIHFTEAKQVSW